MCINLIENLKRVVFQKTANFGFLKTSQHMWFQGTTYLKLRVNLLLK